MSMAFAPGLPMVMAPVNMPSYGPDVGYSAVTGGYNSGAGLAPLSDPYAGQGQGIYNDASMYRGGDFWGGGSDPYAGTAYAGGGGAGGSPFNATPYDFYGTQWDDSYTGGGGGYTPNYTPPSAPPRGSFDWYAQGWDMIPDTTGGQGFGFAPVPVGGGGGGGGGSPPPDAGPSYWGGNNYPDIQGQTPAPAPSPSYGDYSSARDFRGGMSAAEWYGAGYDMIPGAPSYSDYSSGRDFTGGAGYGGGQAAPAAPPFDYNAMNMPSFNGNWGDAAFLAQPGGTAPGLYGSGDYSSARDFRGMSDAEFYGTGYDMIPGATRDRIAQLLGQDADPLNTYVGGESSHAETPRAPDTKMQVGPENLPPTPWGGGFDMRPPTYNNLPEFNQPGTGTIGPPGGRVPYTDPNWTGWEDLGGA